VRVRFTTGGSLGGSEADVSDLVSVSNSVVASQLTGALEAKGATLTFENVNYFVKASTTNEKLHLLKGINGYFSAGKMTALMGSRSVYRLLLANILIYVSPISTSLAKIYSYQSRSGAGKVNILDILLSCSICSYSYIGVLFRPVDNINGRSITPQNKW
jgi:hypothetical protein